MSHLINFNLMKKILLLSIILGLMNLGAYSSLSAQGKNGISNPNNPFNQPDQKEGGNPFRGFLDLKGKGKPSPEEFQKYLDAKIEFELRLYKHRFPSINRNNYLDYAPLEPDLFMLNKAVADEIYNYLKDNRVRAKQGADI